MADNSVTLALLQQDGRGDYGETYLGIFLDSQVSWTGESYTDGCSDEETISNKVVWPGPMPVVVLCPPPTNVKRSVHSQAVLVILASSMLISSGFGRLHKF